MLVYGYTTHLNRYTDNIWVAEYFKASIRRSKSLGYKIKMYGCDFMYIHLGHEVDEFVNIESHPFEFTDDLKIFIHSNEDLNCITIDGDIILNNKLNTPSNCDVIFDRKGQVIHKKNITKYQSHLNVFKKYDVESNVKYFDHNGKYACNVGLIKFNNESTKKIMIDSYLEFKKYYKDNIHQFEKLDDPAIILCEYNFERIINKENLKVDFYSNHNVYTHYASNLKLGTEFKNQVTNILYLNRKNII